MEYNECKMIDWKGVSKIYAKSKSNRYEIFLTKDNQYCGIDNVTKRTYYANTLNEVKILMDNDLANYDL